MASSWSTEVGASARLVVLCLVIFAALPWPARAHDIRPAIKREIVRIQGFRGSPPGQTPGASPSVREVTMAAAGTDSRFAITEWQTFGVEDTPRAPAPAERDRYALQAAPNVLSRFTAARPAQRVTILAERRPGGSDLFILALDLCPPK
jgi:hypothetical protein